MLVRLAAGVVYPPHRDAEVEELRPWAAKCIGIQARSTTTLEPVAPGNPALIWRPGTLMARRRMDLSGWWV
jgi:hypothetical protein